MKEKLETNENIETLVASDTGGLVKQGHRYFLYSTVYPRELAEIPKKLASLVRVSLKINERKWRDDNWLTLDIWNDTNCHKTANFLSEDISMDEERSEWSSHRVAIKRESEKEVYKSFDDFKKNISKKIGDEVGMIQILKGSKLEHSFLVKKSDGENFVFFEKNGYGSDFRVSDLSDIYYSYSPTDDKVSKFEVIAYPYEFKK